MLPALTSTVIKCTRDGTSVVVAPKRSRGAIQALVSVVHEAYEPVPMSVASGGMASIVHGSEGGQCHDAATGLEPDNWVAVKRVSRRGWMALVSRRKHDGGHHGAQAWLADYQGAMLPSYLALPPEPCEVPCSVSLPRQGACRRQGVRVHGSINGMTGCACCLPPGRGLTHPC